MPVIGLALIIQVICAIHVVKTGREVFWIYIVLFIPGIGAALYFITQVLPDLGTSRSVHSAKNSLIKAIDPQRELRKKKAQLEIANTLDNKLKLAEECLEAEFLDDAIELFGSALKGIGEGDADTMVKLSHAYFKNENYQKCIDILNDIKNHNPDYTSTEGHLLYARSLSKLNKIELALEEFKVVSENFPGEEGRIRYAELLETDGQLSKAKEIYTNVISRSKLSPKFYQKKEKQWINIAKSKLRKLN